MNLIGKYWNLVNFFCPFNNNNNTFYLKAPFSALKDTVQGTKYI